MLNNQARDKILNLIDEGEDFYTMVVIAAALDNLKFHVKNNKEIMIDLYGEILIKAIERLNNDTSN